MDDKYHIVPGELAKYQLIIEREDFDPAVNDFRATISWGLFGQSITITREQMFRDEEWHWFCLFDTTDMVGTLWAYTEYEVTDSDVEGDMRTCTDSQKIGIVSDTPCCKKHCRCKKKCDRFVRWERIHRSDAHTLYLNLLTSDGRPITDSNLEQLKVKKHNLI